MKIQVFKNDDNSYQVIVFDETKMLPDPKFARQFQWGAPSTLEPKRDDESPAEFAKRETDHGNHVAEYEAMMLTEARALYELEFSKPAVKPAVLVTERTV